MLRNNQLRSGSRRLLSGDPIESSIAFSHGIEDASHPLASFDPVTSSLPSLATANVLTPAHGHSQPLWGPPDPYLSAGKSIAPSQKALIDMGVTKTSDSDLPESAQTAIKNGLPFLNSNNIKSESLLPGFAPVGGILSPHSPNVPAETPDTFAAQVEWSAGFLNVVDKLPYAAFAYGLIEFFLIRPNLDLYKEDIEEEPADALAETVGTTVIRVGVFAVISVIAVTFFG